MNEQNGIFYGGTSGLQLPFPKKSFPDECKDKSRLGFYATLYNSVEINSSFYKIPQEKTVAKWASEVPQHFKFTFKLWRGITHNKAFHFGGKDIERFLAVIKPAAARSGSLLIQLPPGTLINHHQLEKLLDTVRLNKSDKLWDMAIEFRNKSWYVDRTYEILETYNVALVIQDMPGSTTPMELTSDKLIYLRFHGPNGDYKGSYSDSFIYEYSLYIKEWQEEGRRHTLTSIIRQATP